MIFDLLNNASYNYIQRKYYITKMEKSYEYWRIACQRDNLFIILFFYFQNVHTPAVPLDLQGHRIDASLCPDHIAESYEYCPHHYLRIRSDLPDFIYYGVCGRLPGSQIVDRWYSRFAGSCFGQCNFLCTGNSVSGYFGGTYGQFCHSQSGSGHIHTHLLPPNLGSHSILPAGFEIPGIF